MERWTRTLLGMASKTRYGQSAMLILHHLQVGNPSLATESLSDKPSASLPLLRPVFRSFGGFFSTVKATTAPSQNYKGTGSAPTYGSTPIHRGSNPDSDSEVGFADEGGLMGGSDLAGSSKTFVMHDITPRESDLNQQELQGIHVRNETKIVYHDA